MVAGDCSDDVLWVAHSVVEVVRNVAVGVRNVALEVHNVVVVVHNVVLVVHNVVVVVHSLVAEVATGGDGDGDDVDAVRGLPSHRSRFCGGADGGGDGRGRVPC